MGVRYFCDKCGQEIKRQPYTVYITVRHKTEHEIINLYLDMDCKNKLLDEYRPYAEQMLKR
jgi:hypothetical protein